MGSCASSGVSITEQTSNPSNRGLGSQDQNRPNWIMVKSRYQYLAVDEAEVIQTKNLPKLKSSVESSQPSLNDSSKQQIEQFMVQQQNPKDSEIQNTQMQSTPRKRNRLVHFKTSVRESLRSFEEKKKELDLVYCTRTRKKSSFIEEFEISFPSFQYLEQPELSMEDIQQVQTDRGQGEIRLRGILKSPKLDYHSPNRVAFKLPDHRQGSKNNKLAISSRKRKQTLSPLVTKQEVVPRKTQGAHKKFEQKYTRSQNKGNGQLQSKGKLHGANAHL